MIWIDFKHRLPKDRQNVILWDRVVVYYKGTKVVSELSSHPHVSAFMQEEWEKQVNGKMTPTYSCDGMDSYVLMEYWLPIPELDEDCGKDDFLYSDEQLKELEEKCNEKD